MVWFLSRLSLLSQGLLELLFHLSGRQAAQAGIEPLPIVDGSQEVTDPRFGTRKAAILTQVDPLTLQCFHEALGFGIVVRITLAAHVRLMLIWMPFSFSGAVYSLKAY